MVATDTKLVVLGLGSSLLRDDGIGLLLLRTVEARAEEHWGDRVDFVTGGTQGVALIPYLADRAGIVILDAVTLGSKAGTVHVLRGGELSRLRGGYASELLTAAADGGECPENVFVVGVEPDSVRTGLGVSDPVAKVLHRAVDRAVAIIQDMVQSTGQEAYATSRRRLLRTLAVGSSEF